MKKQFIVIALLFFVFLLIGCDTFIVSPLLPAITASLHVPTGDGGYLVSSYSLLYVVFTFAIGPLSDRIGRKKMILIGLLLFAAASLWSGLAASMELILLARGLTGIGAAFAAPNVWSFIGDHFEGTIRGKVTAIVASALSLGLVIGVPIGSQIAQIADWRSCFYFLSAFTLLMAVLILFRLPESGNSVTFSRGEQSRYRHLLQDRRILASFSVSFLINFANFGLYTFLGYWLQHQFHQPTAILSLVFILAGIGNLSGVFLSGLLSGKHRSETLLLLFIAILSLALLTLSVWRSSLVVTIIDVFIWLAAGGATFSTMQAYVTQLSSRARGTIVALNNGFIWSGTALGSAIVGIIIDRWSFTVSSILCGGCAIIACLLVWFRLDRKSARAQG